MSDEKNEAEPSGASGGSLANAHSARQDAEAKIIVDGIAEIMRIASEPDWIPVTERLPENGKRVLVLVDVHDVCIAAYYPSRFGRDRLWLGDDEASYSPTHWMPLPAPPTDAKYPANAKDQRLPATDSPT